VHFVSDFFCGQVTMTFDTLTYNCKAITYVYENYATTLNFLQLIPFTLCLSFPSKLKLIWRVLTRPYRTDWQTKIHNGASYGGGTI